MLADSPAWTGCWSAVTADDARAALSCEHALAGVTWDVSTLAPGAYIIAGYTHQPPRNLWSPRRGVFKIQSGPDPNAAPPVAAIGQREAFVYADQILEIPVCVSAMAGSSLRLEYALHEDPPSWQLLAQTAVTGALVTVPWTPPPAVHGEDVRLRVRVDDPLGRHGTLAATELLHVLAVPSPTGGADDPAPEAVDMCRSGAPEALYCPPVDGSSSETGDADQPPRSGCACTHGERPPAGLLPPLLMLAWRRRHVIRR